MSHSNKQNSFSDKIIGNSKPFFLFVAALVALIITIRNDYQKNSKIYREYTPAQLDSAGSEEMELTGFRIRERLISGQKKGGVALYASRQDGEPAAILIVRDMDVFRETFRQKGKILVKQFYGAVAANTNEGVKEYANGQDLKNANNEDRKIFTFIPYYSWKSAWWQYLLLIALIAFLGLILISRMRVY